MRPTRSALPPPPWAQAGVSSLQPLPAQAADPVRLAWLLPAAVVLALVVAAACCLGVLALAELGARG